MWYILQSEMPRSKHIHSTTLIGYRVRLPSPEYFEKGLKTVFTKKVMHILQKAIIGNALMKYCFCCSALVLLNLTLGYPIVENKYQLTTEEALKRDYEGKVENYWNTYGKKGTFLGVDDIENKYMGF